MNFYELPSAWNSLVYRLPALMRRKNVLAFLPHYLIKILFLPHYLIKMFFLLPFVPVEFSFCFRKIFKGGAKRIKCRILKGILLNGGVIIYEGFAITTVEFTLDFVRILRFVICSFLSNFHQNWCERYHRNT